MDEPAYLGNIFTEKVSLEDFKKDAINAGYNYEGRPIKSVELASFLDLETRTIIKVLPNGDIYKCYYHGLASGSQD